MAKKRYSRLEEEIIEILDQKDRETAGQRPRFRLPSRPRLRSMTSGRSFPTRRSIDLGGLGWLGGSFGLALAAVLVASFSQLLAAVLAIACILFFLSPIVRGRTSGPAQATSRTWRGRDIDLPPRRSGLIGDLRYRLWQMRNRR